MESYRITNRGTDREKLEFGDLRYWLDIDSDPQNSIGWVVEETGKPMGHNVSDPCSVFEAASVPGAREYVIERTERGIERAMLNAQEDGYAVEPVEALRAELEELRAARPVGGGAPDDCERIMESVAVILAEQIQEGQAYDGEEHALNLCRRQNDSEGWEIDLPLHPDAQIDGGRGEQGWRRVSGVRLDEAEWERAVGQARTLITEWDRDERVRAEFRHGLPR